MPGPLPARFDHASASNVGIQTTRAPSLADTSTASGLTPPTDLFNAMAPATLSPGYMRPNAYARGIVGYSWDFSTKPAISASYACRAVSSASSRRSCDASGLACTCRSKDPLSISEIRSFMADTPSLLFLGCQRLAQAPTGDNVRAMHEPAIGLPAIRSDLFATRIDRCVK